MKICYLDFWGFARVANRELWIEISNLNERMNVKWNWIKGHAGHPGNERADHLANLGTENV